MSPEQIRHEALNVRREAVHSLGLSGIDALVAIVSPGPELLEVSLAEAEKRIAQAEVKDVSLDDLFASLQNRR